MLHHSYEDYLQTNSFGLAQANAGLILAGQFATTYPSIAKQASPTTSKVKAHGQIMRPPRKKRGGQH
jgi:hypothetical protein